jgi:hypothetical protein
MRGLNCVRVRPSGRTGGFSERDECRYDSSAGERRSCDVVGAMFGLVARLNLCD